MVKLDDKYTATEGRVFLSGLQALVRLPIVQMWRDHAAGLNTAAFISGYRGSPLGGYDQELTKATKYLAANDIKFQPGVNEDLAATAIWGTQQLSLSPGAKKDGVVGIWYGKGPGVDRSGDVLKHGNSAGSSKHGGVLCLAGDDHSCKSSTIPHQSDHAFMSAIIPVLYPSSIHEFIELGLLGIAMSRYSGCWVGMKFISDTVETTAAIDLAGEHRAFVLPTDFEMPQGGLNLRWPDPPLVQDERLQNHKPYAAIAFARTNKVDRVMLDTANARLGIVASGKAYEDVLQALRELEIGEAEARAIGLRIYKVRMPWPLEPEGIRHFSEGLDEVLVLEERREIIEFQIKQQLFNWRADVRPNIIGKFDNHDHPYLSLSDSLTVGSVARAIADRVLKLDFDESLKAKIARELAYLEQREQLMLHHHAPTTRVPYYCSGCPHNTSTRVPEGSRALAGIGCHYMVQWMDRHTETFTQMGGEGVSWTGIAPFTDEKHVFANLGDGTYFHSGLLAIRQSVSSGANITYKILYNDAVAMTGGQHVDGNLTPEQVTHQLFNEGVKPIYLLSDHPERYTQGDLAAGVVLKHRDYIDPVMKEIRESPGCSAIVYVQTCAAEKRRRRKRGTMEDPPKRVVINAAVCEGCGDCSTQSNCVSVEPLETEFGRKRQINQSSCNKDYSCLKGFCPSFVTVHGGALRKKSPLLQIDLSPLVEPEIAPLSDHRPWNIAVTGVGGTGVLTIGAILGMAAHFEGKASMILDMAGLAQKGGAVLSHVRLAWHPEEVTSPRIVTGGADLLLAADNVVAASADGVTLCDPKRTHAIVNTHLMPVADFVRNRDFDFRAFQTDGVIRDNAMPGASFLDFASVAEAAIGDSIATNIMMVGYAWQKGLIPLRRESIEQAITLNGVSVKDNVLAFNIGRLLALAPEKLRVPETSRVQRKIQSEMSLDEVIAHRSQHLTAYQNAKLAGRYRALVDRARHAAAKAGLDERIVRAVAVNYAKLLAYKDEYEVARLYLAPEFRASLAEHFEGNYKLGFNLAPPFLPGTDPNGRPLKHEFGPWMMAGFRGLASLKGLRGTPFDLFGRAHDRREERQLIKDYEELAERVLPKLNKANAETALDLLSLPEEIRGFGPVKSEAIARSRGKQAELLAKFESASVSPAAASAAKDEACSLPA
ncbi:MAG: indolepyruvate ferredoxin oxidoreductase family protein [Alphaproteobacteria bacterium]